MAVLSKMIQTDPVKETIRNLTTMAKFQRILAKAQEALMSTATPPENGHRNLIFQISMLGLGAFGTGLTIFMANLAYKTYKKSQAPTDPPALPAPLDSIAVRYNRIEYNHGAVVLDRYTGEVFAPLQPMVAPHVGHRTGTVPESQVRYYAEAPEVQFQTNQNGGAGSQPIEMDNMDGVVGGDITELHRNLGDGNMSDGDMSEVDITDIDMTELGMDENNMVHVDTTSNDPNMTTSGDGEPVMNPDRAGKGDAADAVGISLGHHSQMTEERGHDGKLVPDILPGNTSLAESANHGGGAEAGGAVDTPIGSGDGTFVEEVGAAEGGAETATDDVAASDISIGNGDGTAVEEFGDAGDENDFPDGDGIPMLQLSVGTHRVTEG